MDNGCVEMREDQAEAIEHYGHDMLGHVKFSVPWSNIHDPGFPAKHLFNIQAASDEQSSSLLSENVPMTNVCLAGSPQK